MLFLLAIEKHSPTAKHVFQLQTLQSENSNLRKQATTNIYQVQTGSEYTDTSNHSSLKRRPSARGSRPMSMYETGSGQKPYLPMGEVNHPEESRTRLQPFPAHVSNTTSASTLYSLSSLTPAFPLLSLQIPSLRFVKLGYENRPCVCCIRMSTGACGVPTSRQGPWPKVSQQLWGFWLLLGPLSPFFCPISIVYFPGGHCWNFFGYELPSPYPKPKIYEGYHWKKVPSSSR